MTKFPLYTFRFLAVIFGITVFVLYLELMVGAINFYRGLHDAPIWQALLYIVWLAIGVPCCSYGLGGPHEPLIILDEDGSWGIEAYKTVCKLLLVVISMLVLNILSEHSVIIGAVHGLFVMVIWCVSARTIYRILRYFCELLEKRVLKKYFICLDKENNEEWNKRLLHKLEEDLQTMVTYSGERETIRRLEANIELAKQNAKYDCPSCGKPFVVTGLLMGMIHACPHCNETLTMSESDDLRMTESNA